MKPTKCPDCAFPVKIVSARSWPDGHWEVGVVCSDRACRGFSVYDANGRLLGHPSLSPINPLHADIIRVLDGKRGSGASPKIGDVLAIQDRNRPAGENGEARPNPVICWKCREFMWIVGAHDFRRSWEVALLCSNSGCDGWGIYSSKRNLATSRTMILKPDLSRTHYLIHKAKEEKRRRRVELPQKDIGDVREFAKSMQA